ncbi:MAG: ABC-F family ATP-binding cassette domain-containing protein [Clostridia bacterium]
MSLLKIENLSHSFGDKVLYKDVSFEIYKGEHIGIIGENGSGKTTLINIISGLILPDKGRVIWQSNIKIGVLDQYAKVNQDISVIEYLKTAFEYLYKIEEKLNNIYIEICNNCTDSLLNKISKYQEILDKNDFYLIDNIIQKVTDGLGIKVLGLDNKLSSLSGGQRAKVILGKLLLENPDVLILDEPTNFLDIEHIEWLTSYIKGFEGACIVVSHDYNFLDNISLYICDIEFSKITKYRGNYSACINQKNASKEKHIHDYITQRKVIEKTEIFIAKHIVRPTSSKMAKDRQKKLERMDIIEKPSKDAVKPHINFKSKTLDTRIVLRINNLEIGYKYPLFSKMKFKILNGEKIVITGFNGIGKSTLIKTLLNIIPKISGEFEFANNIKIGYYAQDFKWDNVKLTPIQIVKDDFPDLSDMQIRKKLAQAGLKAKNSMQAITTLSGGEQAKVNLCKLMLISCNLLVLDEPTNHLDKLSKEALKEALIKFEGTVIMVSHEESFYTDWATKIVNIQDLCNNK